MRKKEVNTNDMEVLLLLNIWGLSDFQRNRSPVYINSTNICCVPTMCKDFINLCDM